MLRVYGYSMGQEWLIGVLEVCSVQIHILHWSNGMDLANAKGQKWQCVLEAHNIRSWINGTLYEM